MKGKSFADCPSFDEMGEKIFEDKAQGLVIRRGQIYECPTVTGHTNLIVMAGLKDGWVYYFHGEKGMKAPAERVIKAVLHGDIYFRKLEEVDKERISLSVVAIDAIANRRTMEEQMEYVGKYAVEEYCRDLAKGA